MRMPNLCLRGYFYQAPLLFASSLPHRVEDAMCNSSGSPPFYRLTNVTNFQVTEILFPIGTCHGQIAQFANRIEGTVIVAAVCVVARAVVIGA
jgi:hypothetical protein